jgi:hypothetical protein
MPDFGGQCERLALAVSGADTVLIDESVAG